MKTILVIKNIQTDLLSVALTRGGFELILYNSLLWSPSIHSLPTLINKASEIFSRLDITHKFDDNSMVL